MARANPTTHQYEPLRVPGNWGPEERKLILQLTDVFDDIYRRYGRLRMEDLAKPLSKEITDATGNITTLQQTATGLQTQVNNLGNRNRTYLPGTAPPVSERVVGDLLIDTANGNILKRWNGSSWVAVQDGAISIAQQTADKIAWIIASGTSGSNMTLTDKLYELVTNKVMITANQEIALAVEGMQVGGRNLIPNSGNFNDLSGWTHYPSAATVLVQTDNYFNRSAIQIIPDGTSGYVIRTPKIQEEIITGTPYTVSICMSLSTHPGVVRVAMTDNSNTVFYATEFVRTYYASNYYVFTATVTTTGFAAKDTRSLNISITEPSEARKILWVQLEQGNKSSPWKPAEEDPASGVKTSKVTINDTGIDMTTGGTFTTTSQNFNIDAAGNVTMKGQVEAASGKIAGFDIGGNAIYKGKPSLIGTQQGIYLGTDGIALGDTSPTSVGGIWLQPDGGIFGKAMVFKNTTLDDDVILNLVSERANGESARAGFSLRHGATTFAKEDGYLFLVDETGDVHPYITMRWNNNNEKHLILDGIVYRYGPVADNGIFQMRNLAAGTNSPSGGYSGEMYVKVT